MSLAELGVIALVLVIFLKPEDWPKFLRKAGRIFGQLRKMITDFENQVKSFSYEDDDDKAPK